MGQDSLFLDQPAVCVGSLDGYLVFMASLRIRHDDKLERIVSEVQAINTAVLDGRAAEAERLWRDKFERWVRDLVDQLPEPFDEDLWAALTAGRPTSSTLRGPG